MYQSLAETFQGLGTWLVSVAPYVPLSQLSILTWAVFAASRSFSKAAFNAHEQGTQPLSKMPFQ